MPRVTWFEYFTEDTEKDLAFYKDVFGWDSQQWGEMPYWLVMTGDKAEPGIDGAMAPPPMEGTPKVVLTISVDDNDAFTEKAVAAGATVAVPKRAVPGSGWLTYLSDPAGVVFGIMQYDDSAA